MKLIHKHNLVEVYEISPRLYFRKGDLYTRKQCNCAYIVGPTTVTAVDIPTLEAADEMLEESRALFGKPIRQIIITHNHGDHARGLPRFRSEPVTVFCSHRYLEELAVMLEGGPAHLCGIQREANLMLEGIPVTLFTFEDTAHSRGDLFVYLPEEGYLCTGDTVGSPADLYFQDADPPRWIYNIGTLKRWGARQILPGHGGIYSPSIIDSTAEHLRNLIQAAQGCLNPLPPVVIDGAERESVAAHAGANLPSLDTIAGEMLASGSPLAAAIIEQAGEEQALRQLRMMLRWWLRNRLR